MQQSLVVRVDGDVMVDDVCALHLRNHGFMTICVAGENENEKNS